MISPTQTPSHLRSNLQDTGQVTSTSIPENNQAYDTNKIILEAVALQRLPKITPKIFEGNEMEFLRWESSFDALIASNTRESKTMLHYLCKFLKGEPLKIVEQWDHLKHIANCIPEQRKVEIGLLIGRNVPQAMKTREVVNGKDNEPWAERYDLGWTIIGNVCKSPDGDDSGEPFKVNRIVIRDSVTTKEIHTPSDVQRMMELDYSERKQG